MGTSRWRCTWLVCWRCTWRCTHRRGEDECGEDEWTRRGRVDDEWTSTGGRVRASTRRRVHGEYTSTTASTRVLQRVHEYYSEYTSTTRVREYAYSTDRRPHPHQ